MSRQTIANYVSILEETFVVHVVRPFYKHKQAEIVKAPKVYGFDTGFVCYERGWRELRRADSGVLWEHCVLNELHAKLQTRSIKYWRNKKGNEVDFVINDKRSPKSLTAIECKFSISNQSFSSEGLKELVKNFEALRKLYPVGDNYVVAHDVDEPFARGYNGISLIFINAKDLALELS